MTDPLGNDAVHTESSLGGPCTTWETELDQYQGSHTGGTLLAKSATVYSYVSGYHSQPATNVVPATVTKTNVITGESLKSQRPTTRVLAA